MLKFQYSTLAALALSLALGLSATAGAQTEVTDFYHVARLSGVTWLVAPNGDKNLLLGLNHVHLISASAPRTDLAPVYIDQRAAQILAAMELLGFNAFGGDADADLWHRGLPYVQSLDLSRHLLADQQTPLVDVYAPAFRAHVLALAQAACAPQSRDPDLVGYFSDDGLSWDPSRPAQAAAVLRFYLALPLSAPGRQHAMDYLRVRYNSDVERIARAWGVKARDFLDLTGAAAGAAPQAAFAADAAGFAQDVLLHYLQAAADAIHSADPNHLYLGANLQVAAALASWTAADVTSVAVAGGADLAQLLAGLAGLPPHPMLVSVAGCAAPPDLHLLPGLANSVGLVWSPSGDWQSGACAAQAQAFWAPFNRQAQAAHAGAH